MCARRLHHHQLLLLRRLLLHHLWLCHKWHCLRLSLRLLLCWEVLWGWVCRVCVGLLQLRLRLVLGIWLLWHCVLLLGRVGIGLLWLWLLCALGVSIWLLRLRIGILRLGRHRRLLVDVWLLCLCLRRVGVLLLHLGWRLSSQASDLFQVASMKQTILF